MPKHIVILIDRDGIRHPYHLPPLSGNHRTRATYMLETHQSEWDAERFFVVRARLASFLAFVAKEETD